MKSAVIVIDVQRGLFEPLPWPADAEAVIARINNLTLRARQAGVPVVFVQHEVGGSELAFETQGWDLDKRLWVELGDHKVRKTTPDSFLRTRLIELLNSLEVSHLIICGYASEFCVDTTVRRAAALGYQVTLASDAHTTHAKPHAGADQIREHHNATLPNITSFGPKISAIPTACIKL